MAAEAEKKSLILEAEGKAKVCFNQKFIWPNNIELYISYLK